MYLQKVSVRKPGTSDNRDTLLPDIPDAIDSLN
jgi:hypothetical protein